jgi:hypothetical protein
MSAGRPQSRIPIWSGAELACLSHSINQDSSETFRLSYTYLTHLNAPFLLGIGAFIPTCTARHSSTCALLARCDCRALTTEISVLFACQ